MVKLIQARRMHRAWRLAGKQKESVYRFAIVPIGVDCAKVAGRTQRFFGTSDMNENARKRSLRESVC